MGLPASSCNTFGVLDRILVPAPAASTITAEITAGPGSAGCGRVSDDVMSTAHPSCEKALRGSGGIVNMG
jgi:hypothetical protein